MLPLSVKFGITSMLKYLKIQENRKGERMAGLTDYELVTTVGL